VTEPYQPPQYVPDPRPGVIFWYRVYAWMMAVLSFALGAVVGALAGPDVPVGATFVMLACAPLAVLFAVAATVPFKPWGWTLGLVAITLGVSSLAVIFAVPLLFLWFKPTVKAAFARL